MRDENLPSLERLVRSKIRRRILAAMIILAVGSVLVSIAEAALSYSDLVTRLEHRADALQNLIISEVLVHNEDATSV